LIAEAEGDVVDGDGAALRLVGRQEGGGRPPVENRGQLPSEVGGGGRGGARVGGGGETGNNSG